MSYGVPSLLIRDPRTPGELNELGGLMADENRLVRWLAIRRYRRGIHRAGDRARRLNGWTRQQRREFDRDRRA